MIQTLIFNGLRDTQSFFDSDQSFLAIYLFGPFMIWTCNIIMIILYY